MAPRATHALIQQHAYMNTDAFTLATRSERTIGQ